MTETSHCLKVKKVHGDKALFLTKKLGISNRELEIYRNANYISVPLIHQLYENEIATIKANIPDFELTTSVFIKKKRRRRTIEQILQKQLPLHLVSILPRALDIIGDIAIAEIPSELNNHKSLIGEAILSEHKNVRTVLAKVGVVTGTYRLREFEIIAGENKTLTTHKEYGCYYQVDVTKVYFSPRLSHEHKRVASLVRKGETVIDLFAGIGPFSVLIAKNNADAKVYAVDINPEAIRYLRRNVRLNRVEDRIIAILGNSRKVIDERLLGVADRVIMNLPEKAIEFIDSACKAVKSSGGVVHYYTFIRLPDTLEKAQLRFSEFVEKAGRKVEDFHFARTIRATAPYEWQVALDAHII